MNFDELAEKCREYNIGKSDYAKKELQPWDVFKLYRYENE